MLQAVAPDDDGELGLVVIKRSGETVRVVARDVVAAKAF